MKVYIASKYTRHKDINRKIFKILSKNGHDVFLPETINCEGGTLEEMNQIACKCYNAIESSDVVLVVSPYGQSVSAEIGYAISNKLKYEKIKIILFRINNENKMIEDKEAMIAPFFDYKMDVQMGKINEALNELLSKLDMFGG